MGSQAGNDEPQIQLEPEHGRHHEDGHHDELDASQPPCFQTRR